MVSTEKSIVGENFTKIFVAIAVALILYGIFRLVDEIIVYFRPLGGYYVWSLFQIILAGIIIYVGVILYRTARKIPAEINLIFRKSLSLFRRKSLLVSPAVVVAVAALIVLPFEPPEPLVIPPKGSPVVDEEGGIRFVDLPVEWEWNDPEIILFYLFSHYFPTARTTGLGPLVYTLDFSDPHYRRAEEVARYLWDLGFYVYYSNLAYKYVEGYRLRMSLIGSLRLFEVVFQMEIYSSDVGGPTIYGCTTPVIPRAIRDFVRTVEHPPPPILFCGIKIGFVERGFGAGLPENRC